MKRRAEREARKAALEESERKARTAEPEEANLQTAKEDTIIEDSLKKALNVAGGSKEDRERKIREMLARLIQDTSAYTTVDATVSIASPTDATNTTANNRNVPVASDTNFESKADKATATVETSIPANNASKPPDPDKVRADSLSKDEGEGVEVGHIKGDDLSEPG